MARLNILEYFANVNDLLFSYEHLSIGGTYSLEAQFYNERTNCYFKIIGKSSADVILEFNRLLEGNKIFQMLDAYRTYNDIIYSENKHRKKNYNTRGF